MLVQPEISHHVTIPLHSAVILHQDGLPRHRCQSATGCAPGPGAQVLNELEQLVALDMFARISLRVAGADVQKHRGIELVIRMVINCVPVAHEREPECRVHGTP